MCGNETTTDKISLVNFILDGILTPKSDWKRIAGWDDYWISKDGRVCSCRLKTPKLLTPSKAGGYEHVTLCRTGECGPEHKHVNVHSLVAHHFIHPRLPGLEVNHKDNNPLNNRVENLEYVTSSGNTMHSVNCGRWPVGEKRWNSKLTREQVVGIKLLLRDGVPAKQIASMLGVTEPAIHHIKSGRNWKHVTLPAEEAEPALTY